MDTGFGRTTDTITSVPADRRTQRCNYYTGGRASPGVLGLVEFHVSAWSPGGSTKPIPPQNIVIGALGPVGSDGVLWRLLPNATNIDITPRVPGNNNYTFNVTATNHLLTLTANGYDLSVNQPGILRGPTGDVCGEPLPTRHKRGQHDCAMEPAT